MTLLHTTRLYCIRHSIEHSSLVNQIATAIRGLRREEVYILLGSKGVELEELTSDGNTILYESVRAGNVSLTRILLRMGANVNFIRDDGITPLLCAVIKGYTILCRLLLNYGAQLDTNIIRYSLLYSNRALVFTLIGHKYVPWLIRRTSIY